MAKEGNRVFHGIFGNGTVNKIVRSVEDPHYDICIVKFDAGNTETVKAGELIPLKGE